MLRLGCSAERQEDYPALFRCTLGEVFIEDIHITANGGWAMGGEWASSARSFGR
ncbi:MAG TPA: hypothetical protein VGL83_16460 [Stellaceae bacterium]|jgi:hypothetical protein